MEQEQLSSLAVTHLLQHTLRSLCTHETSQWVYAVFWRILPRNYPPPKWDTQSSHYDESRGNRRNWILAWEDGFCNFAASTAEINSSDFPSSFQQHQGLQPEQFFKMSHEIYNFGEGLIGKVAADHSHKWIYKEPTDQENNFLSNWHNATDSHPRTWEAQFQSGIKTIALIAVREGVIQLGAIHKVIEDLSYVVLLRKKFSYIESIPGVLLPHPSSTPFPYKMDGYVTPETCYYQGNNTSIATPAEIFYDHFNQTIPYKITPAMSSLEALLSQLPFVLPNPSTISGFSFEPQALTNHSQSHYNLPMQRPMEFMGLEKVAKEEVEDVGDHEQDYNNIHRHDVGESSRPNNVFF